ncbi:MULTISPECIES: primosomal protein N' [unclassified Roseofilum]|uniref:primosomal protein N' n=1 Tax=unclassified Roseofilum TaxID=2620099 RepID=UPI001AFD51A1|nr:MULTISPECIES: primosomal protein N' [unclassified Roseofilum]MBP0008287.1 primosomal protein N' [Roseofilum sp. Belize Diploria]MBP0032742.1 primosomal protein N' [Roseofilum sp. Belize BBD 4]
MISKLDRLQPPITSCRVAASKNPFYIQTSSSSRQCWVEVLLDVDRQELEEEEPKLYTYAIGSNLRVQLGDILIVPCRSQQVGAIAIRLLSAPPANLPPEKIKSVHEVISSGFFPPSYWQLLNQVAHYYHTPLIRVIRMALPPGLLAKSQRRIRLTESIPKEAQVFLDFSAKELLNVLSSRKTGDSSWPKLKKQVYQADRALKDLLKRGWVESYLEPPQPPRPKRQQVVTLVKSTLPEPEELTSQQQEILNVLARQGGEMLVTELVQQGQTSSGAIKTLEKKQWVTISQQEQLRYDTGPMPDRDTPKPLTPAQAQALAAIQGRSRQRCGALSDYHPFLLHGITGSGKTEVYLQAIAPILEQGQSILVLVPEIGLTPQLTDRFRARFGEKIRVYHSALSDGERYDTWRQMLQGTPQIVIGTRSAVFAPLPSLGLIILDEEHDTSFKQSQPAPTYHTRQVAQWRAQLENCPLILGSATPSMETWFSSGPGKSCTRLSLPERVGNRPLPPISIVDLRRELKQGNRSIFSRSLQDQLRRLGDLQQQGILFIPRRGHSTFVSCRSCGHVLECPHCDVSLSYHYTHEGATERLRCHYCNFSQVQPSHCPECQSPYLKHFGTGTQRVTHELAKLFPELRVIRFDSDTTRTKNAHRTLLTRFVQGEADLLVGTQMLTKGLDIPGVTLVGVVAADGLLHQGDYRAGEEAVQILTQVAGRAGRGDDPGQVIIQTYSPDHRAIQAVQQNAYATFMQQELQEREAYHYPPYSSLVLFRFSGLDLMEVQTAADRVADVLESRAGGYQVLGPAPARVMRVSDAYRWQILLKFPPTEEINLPSLAELRSLHSKRVSFSLDIDPLNFG